MSQRILLAAFFAAATAQAGQFNFAALIQAGAAVGNWEIGVGDTTATQADTETLTTHWANSTPRAFEVEYLKSTNTLNVRVYDGATTAGGSVVASYQPTGGAAVGPDAIWTLPASAFFTVATAGPILPTSITVSNLTLSGVSGAITILQPIQSTTLASTRGFFGGTSTVTQSQDVTFLADSTGSWRLSGTVALTGLSGIPVLGADGNELTFGISASAVDPVPEPGTWGLMGFGLLSMVGYREMSRRKKTA